ncbi:hypothetical protein JAAARDRAFT_28398 [Jaapia argillacea MUCL 33604]|uniref:Uncharacterized protein n=1 Tax=Jaapia argillacea MUCL 33604 TaxID=933084 RepID=A0A067QMK0_9AGAM|nr:hypothetical protein JAAARDRAFT_28398 [Jaapia argillacea MUCL 33604]
MTFATGGYDRVVHLWELKDDFSSAIPQTLAIKHSSLIQCLLAIRDTSHKLISSSADRDVNYWDLASERVVNTIQVSNSVYHVHETSSPFCTLLEVANREKQYEIRDHRIFPHQAAQRFGHHISQFRGRYMKGCSKSSWFASGDQDGAIHIWDVRNLRREATTIPCFNGRKVIQVVFGGGTGLAACSDDNQLALLTTDA